MSMLLDLREMRGSEDRVERTCPAEDFSADPSDDYVVASEVWLSARVLRDGAKYRFVGRMGSTLRLSCCRCLDSFDVRQSLSVDLLFLPYGEIRGEGDREISDEDLTTAFYREEQIDLESLIREQFQLSLPMKPLCRENCKGLCPVCGVNSNDERCSCDTSWQDPRLEALKTLRFEGRKD